MSLNVPIIIVAYNRPKSLSRLLSSIENADYPNNHINLIISIDRDEKSGNSKVLEIAENFNWRFGEKKIIYQENNLGLRKHIIQCGDFTQEYGAVILLEDDLYVAQSFYHFAIASLQFSEDMDEIGGISLYNHQLNVHNKAPFNPLEDGYDNWYFQFASSWGQAWTKQQWASFKNWYLNNQKIQKKLSIPDNVSNWSDKSWLKFYIAYLIEKNRFFLYPKISMSTNFSDVGTHMGEDSTIYQVPLYASKKETYNFSTISDSRSVYDAFFENKKLEQVLKLPLDSLCVDLYGLKEKQKQRYLLTSQILNFEVIKSYGRSLRPLDANIYADINGNDIFLYDTSLNRPHTTKLNTKRRILYNIKYLTFNDSSKIFFNQLKMKGLSALKKIIPFK